MRCASNGKLGILRDSHINRQRYCAATSFLVSGTKRVSAEHPLTHHHPSH